MALCSATLPCNPESNNVISCGLRGCECGSKEGRHLFVLVYVHCVKLDKDVDQDLNSPVDPMVEAQGDFVDENIVEEPMYFQPVITGVPGLWENQDTGFRWFPPTEMRVEAHEQGSLRLRLYMQIKQQKSGFQHFFNQSQVRERRLIGESRLLVKNDLITRSKERNNRLGPIPILLTQESRVVGMVICSFELEIPPNGFVFDFGSMIKTPSLPGASENGTTDKPDIQHVPRQPGLFPEARYHPNHPRNYHDSAQGCRTRGLLALPAPPPVDAKKMILATSPLPSSCDLDEWPAMKTDAMRSRQSSSKRSSDRTFSGMRSGWYDNSYRASHHNEKYAQGSDTGAYSNVMRSHYSGRPTNVPPPAKQPNFRPHKQTQNQNQRHHVDQRQSNNHGQIWEPEGEFMGGPNETMYHTQEKQQQVEKCNQRPLPRTLTHRQNAAMHDLLRPPEAKSLEEQEIEEDMRSQLVVNLAEERKMQNMMSHNSSSISSSYKSGSLQMEDPMDTGFTAVRRKRAHSPRGLACRP